ncbi:MAG: hypothetical protein WD824_24745 [Cyclobacteriaceae bacterium]
MNLTNSHNKNNSDPKNDLEANEMEVKGVCYTGISLIVFVIVLLTSIGFLVL